MTVPRPASSSDTPALLTVSQLTALVKDLLEQTFDQVWVVGELSDVARPQSGHIYFTLKDENAQLRGVIWRSYANRLPFELEDGMEVICGGSLDVYPPRGTYQLVVRRVEPQGVGGLQLALRQLQQKLADEGLFDAHHKQPLPAFPRRIAVVTSPTGAAIRDFLEVLRRRWKAVEVIVVPTRVQGEGAAEEIVDALRRAQQLEPPPDVIVLTRGGGSLEDLWCFNDELVVRAVFAASCPIVSAVGHEIDVTLADLAADVRALTPSEAAERVVPSVVEVTNKLRTLKRRLATALRNRAAAARARLQMLEERRVLRKPLEPIYELTRRLDELESQSRRALDRLCEGNRRNVHHLAGRLESLSPLAVLARGYTITCRAETDELIRAASQLEPGDPIKTRYATGSTISRVESVTSDDPFDEDQARSS